MLRRSPRLLERLTAAQRQHDQTSFIARLKTYHPMAFQNPGYAYGDTLLHRGIRHCCEDDVANLAMINNLIAKTGVDAVTAMSMMTNDEGNLPIDLLEASTSLDDDSYEALHQQLTDIMKSYPVKALNELLKPQDVNNEIRLIADKRLNHNLTLAVYLINKVRLAIKKSNTHPSNNQLNLYEQNQISESIAEMRHQHQVQPISSDKISNVSSYAKRYACGNCYEFSHAVLDLLRKTDPGVSAETVSIKRGDHVFVVIDRKPDSDITNAATWGEHAVICDAWSGEAYPATQLPFKLMNFLSLTLQDSTLNMLSSYNPRFHELTAGRSMPAKKASYNHSDTFFNPQKKRSANESLEAKPRPGKRRG